MKPEPASPDSDVPTPRVRRTRVDFDCRLLELAGRQHYVVARAQLREFGTDRQIDHRLKQGPLERVHEGVYRIVGSPNTWHQRLLAACIASSGANAASFRAGLRLFDLPGGEEIVEVTAPRHRRMQLEGVTIHESFFLTDLDVTYIDGIPVTRPARLLCDLALLVERGELRPYEYELALQEAIRRNLVDIPRLWREWERLGGAWRPGGRTVEAVLNAYVPPIRQTETKAETRLLQLIRAAGLPEPVPQFRVALSPTRKARLDFAWPDEKVYCEFDPYKWRGGRDHYMHAATRRLQLERLGWRGVSVTDEELDTGGRLATQLLLQRLPRAG